MTYYGITQWTPSLKFQELSEKFETLEEALENMDKLATAVADKSDKKYYFDGTGQWSTAVEEYEGDIDDDWLVPSTTLFSAFVCKYSESGEDITGPREE